MTLICVNYIMKMRIEEKYGMFIGTKQRTSQHLIPTSHNYVGLGSFGMLVINWIQIFPLHPSLIG